jgi:hypothetical protein
MLSFHSIFVSWSLFEVKCTSHHIILWTIQLPIRTRKHLDGRQSILLDRSRLLHRVPMGEFRTSSPTGSKTCPCDSWGWKLQDTRWGWKTQGDPTGFPWDNDHSISTKRAISYSMHVVLLPLATSRCTNEVYKAQKTWVWILLDDCDLLEYSPSCTMQEWLNVKERCYESEFLGRTKSLNEIGCLISSWSQQFKTNDTK